jgi:hypothetical protein
MKALIDGTSENKKVVFDDEEAAKKMCLIPFTTTNFPPEA